MVVYPQQQIYAGLFFPDNDSPVCIINSDRIDLFIDALA